MERIVGKDAKMYNYLESVVMAVKNYYGYEFVKSPNTKDEIINYYQKQIKSGNKKVVFINDDKIEFITFGFDNLYNDAEAISMLYRVLEELKIEDISVRLNASETLKDYLEHLDVLYEGNSLDNYFEIVANADDKDIVLASGEKTGNILCSSINIKEVINLLKTIFDDYEFDTLAQVYIVGETSEERLTAMKLAQDLRWCEIVVKTDNTNLDKETQLENANSCNFIIMMENEDLNKGLIKVIDNYTKEEVYVDEAEIIDYIVSNI